MERTTVPITTCLPQDIWKMAVLNDISWSKALKLGIEGMLGIDKDKEKIEAQILQTEIKLKHLKEEKNKMEEEKKKKEKKKTYIIDDGGGHIGKD